MNEFRIIASYVMFCEFFILEYRGAMCPHSSSWGGLLGGPSAHQEGGSRSGVYETRSGVFFLSTIFRYIVCVLYDALFSSRKIISFKYNDL